MTPVLPSQVTWQIVTATECHQLSAPINKLKFTRITINPQQMDGVPCIRGLRIPVSTLVGMVAEKMTDHEIIEAFPDLEPEDIHEALLYAAEAV